MKRLIQTAVWLCLCICMGCSAPSHDILYQQAVRDAAQVSADKVYPLVCMDKKDPQMQWIGDQAVLVIWHNVPHIYPEDQEIQIQTQVIWAVSLKELQNKYNREKPSNCHERLCQLFGLPKDHAYDYFSVISVDPKNVKRPAYTWQPDRQTVFVTFDETANESYRAWFRENEIKSMQGKGYPWTRLGYTYDWANNGSRYGLTEFIIQKGALVHVLKTYTNQEFFEYLSTKKED